MNDATKEELELIAQEPRCSDCEHSLAFACGDHDEYCRVCDCGNHGMQRFMEYERTAYLNSIQRNLDTGFYTDETTINWAKAEIKHGIAKPNEIFEP